MVEIFVIFVSRQKESLYHILCLRAVFCLHGQQKIYLIFVSVFPLLLKQNIKVLKIDLKMGIFHVMIVKGKKKLLVEVTQRSHNLHRYINALVKNAKENGFSSYKFKDEFIFNLNIYDDYIFFGVATVDFSN